MAGAHLTDRKAALGAVVEPHEDRREILDLDVDEIERLAGAAAWNASREPRGFLRFGIVVVMSPSTSVIRSPLMCCARSHQCEPMSPSADEAPPLSGSSRHE